MTLHWVRQYAHTTSNMGRAHIAQEGTAFTLCALPLRDSAVWGHEYHSGRTVKGWCHTCAHHARQQFAREAVG